MTDLCYNCGDCHLPKSCAVELKHCITCDNLGHTYNFCPLSVRKQDPAYQFWALCHNCDIWHLPNPCGKELHHCNQCGNGGHIELFCPINAIPRGPNKKGQKEEVGAKRQRTDGSEGSEASTIGPDIVHKIKMDTAMNFADLLNKGYDVNQILHSFATSGNHAPANGMNFPNGAVPSTPTPAPAMAYSARNDSIPTLYSIQHDRFNRGDLAHPQPQPPIHQYASPYSDRLQAHGGEMKGPGDNINVGAAAALQNLAQSAVEGALTNMGTPGSLTSPAGGHVNGPYSSTPRFGEQIQHSVASTSGEFNPNLQAQAYQQLGVGLQVVNPNFAENIPLHHSHTLPAQAADDSIAVGSTQAEQAEPELAPPPLALRKDGQPKKKQPKRVQPPRNKAQGS